jgi:hypothetical protein
MEAQIQQLYRLEAPCRDSKERASAEMKALKETTTSAPPPPHRPGKYGQARDATRAQRIQPLASTSKSHKHALWGTGAETVAWGKLSVDVDVARQTKTKPTNVTAYVEGWVWVPSVELKKTVSGKGRRRSPCIPHASRARVHFIRLRGRVDGGSNDAPRGARNGCGACESVVDGGRSVSARR